MQVGAWYKTWKKSGSKDTFPTFVWAKRSKGKLAEDRRVAKALDELAAKINADPGEVEKG
jgi:hypothetical protein